ncbi:MAG: sulfate adenylyltransferase [Candidatus Dormibacteria bacterium]
MKEGFVVWFTGLSGAGKSTLAQALAPDLERRGLRVEILDGDAVRENLSKGLGFSREDRDTNIRRIGYVAELLSRNGAAVIVAAISPYREVRDEVRARIANFVEVHVDCDLDELVRRDVKGLYRKAISGEIKNFTGVSDPYEPPLQPEVRVDSRAQDESESLGAILATLERLNHLPSRNGHRTLPAGAIPHGGRLLERLAPESERARLALEAADLPVIELDSFQASDFELLAVGALSPLTGFMGEADLLSVRDRMRLASGLPWSLPVILTTETEARPGDRVALQFEGRPLATLTVEERFRFDRDALAAAVFGTTEVAHPGVARTLAEPDWALAGPVEVFALPDGPFGEHRLTPAETRRRFAELGWRTVTGFQTRNPVHRAHEYLQKVALETVDGLLLHPLVGDTKGDDIPADVRMRCYQVLLESHYPQDRVVLSVFPASMRYAGPREAVFHAIVRKNYGCTHFIVGRDHAGVGSYYGTYAAQEIFDRFEPGELGIEILRFEHSFFCRRCGAMATTRTCPHGESDRLVLSGTRVRELLRAGEDLPEEFTRPEVARVLREATLAVAAT